MQSGGYRAPIRVRPSLVAPGSVRTMPAAEPKAHDPISPFDLTAVVKMVEDLKGMHSKVLEALTHAGTIEDLKKMHAETLQKGERMQATLAAVKQGPAGPVGKAAKEIDVQEVARHAATLIPTPKDGKDAEPVDVKKIAKQAAKLIVLPEAEHGKNADPEEIMNSLIERIASGEVAIPIESVKGLDKKFTETHSKISTEVEQYGKNTWKRGGGDTVTAGTNVTITTDASGKKVINALGAALAVMPVTGTVDDSNKTFSAATQPTLLNINGAFYLKTGGAYTWTYVGTTITLNQPVGTGGSIFGI